MTAIALRGMLERKLRSALTAVAILLGVAMIAGTYVQTDQISKAFEEITAQSNAGIDAVVEPREAFGSATASTAGVPLLDPRLVEQVRGVEGVAAVDGEFAVTGQLVIDGEAIETGGAPGQIFDLSPEPFNPTEIVQGSQPGRGEIAVLDSNAEKHDVAVGDRVGLTTRTGTQDVTVSGIFQFGDGSVSLGASTIMIATEEDIRAWYDPEGYARIQAAAQEGTSPEQLVAALERELPRAQVTVQTGAEDASQESADINAEIGGFLTPALLTFAGAAVLVGAFIIFNTFSITVAQRTREFALLRAMGATRRQVLSAVAIEALVLGLIASVLGILAGLGFASLLSALFDAVGFGIPRSGLVLEVRTIIVSLAVGVGVTLLAAVAPAVRATRVAPVEALSEAPQIPTAGRRRAAKVAAVVVSLLGLGLLISGLFGGGTATTRLTSMAGGAVLLFIGVALSARYAVRPLASVIGWPVERLFKTPGRLARENAMRNPGRTAITSAALMVGLGLVVFVAVFAAGLKTSFTDKIDELVRADIFVYSESFVEIPVAAQQAIDRVDGVAATESFLFDQVKVNGKGPGPTDAITSIDPQRITSVYTFDWVDGEDAVLSELGPNSAVVEEQFAKAHDLQTGDTYSIQTRSGAEREMEVLGIYRDPTILGGTLMTHEAIREVTPVRDPFFILVALEEGADAAAVQTAVERAVEPFPAASVRSNAEYREDFAQQLDQLVGLLYALLAMSVVISLFGIANSLFLSIHERTRELGLLRAIGATRAQVKRIVRYESVITAVIGGVLGMAIGVLFAFLITTSLDEWGLGFSLPVGQLIGFLALSVIVGVLGAVMPARRSARLDVLDALHYE
jgi:putative ABC transport system permease protein